MASTVPWSVSRLFGQLVASRQRTGAPVCAIAGLAIAVAATPALARMRNARLCIFGLLLRDDYSNRHSLRICSFFLPVAYARSVDKSLTQSRVRASMTVY